MNTQLIIRPIITEKSMREAEKGKFTFQVDKRKEKQEIKKAIEQAYNVHVISMQTITVKGKSKRGGKKMVVIPKSAYKKAIATLQKGEKIALFDVGEKK